MYRMYIYAYTYSVHTCIYTYRQVHAYTEVAMLQYCLATLSPYLAVSCTYEDDCIFLHTA